MPFHFSATALGFFHDAIHADLPADAIAVTPDDHAALMQKQAEGWRIAANDDGAPVAICPPDPTLEQRVANLRHHRNRLLSASDYTQMPDAPLTIERREAWRLYRQALRDLPETATDLNVIEWPIAPSA